MELLDITIEIERYIATKGINAEDIKVSELIELMTDDGMEEF